MARKVRQDIAGYNVGIAALSVEYQRVLECTLLSKEEQLLSLDDLQRVLDRYRRVQRELMTKARTEGYRAPSKSKSVTTAKPRALAR